MKKLFSSRAGWVSLFFFLALGAHAKDYKVGLILDKGGKDDKSFNSAAFRGATRARDEIKDEIKGEPKIFLKYVEATDDNAFESLTRSFAQKDFDLIIGIGVSQAEAIKKVSAQFPGKKFAIVDAEVKAPNVRALLFEEHEGSYLVGAIAAMVTQSGTLGFIGGMDIPLIRRFEMGYVAGAKKVNPKIKVISNFVGISGDSWNNPAKGKELAVSQFGAGADIIFAPAGASNLGVFDAAEEKSTKEKKKFAMGVDSNQNWIKPGYILTSMLKRVDQAVFAAIEDGVKGKFTAGTQRFGLANQGIDYAVDQYNEKLLSPKVKAEAERIKAEIVAGKIKMPDFYLKK
ncbi:BMP family ABC transporter substrate-binding protein [Bdellovibrionota bacterium FG-2]